MLAGGDDFRDELLTVHAHLHGGPVLRQLGGKLQLIVGLQRAVLGKPDQNRHRENRRRVGKHFMTFVFKALLPLFYFKNHPEHVDMLQKKISIKIFNQIHCPCFS